MLPLFSICQNPAKDQALAALPLVAALLTINGNIFWKKFGYHGHSAKETKKR